ncbi:fasciclin-like arabinogalactan protein 12 [Humulus lupulus]|uniref:fasciclin-like arabinogalactan protein 12 n=1 Tax=Humulus lupulus TaxID=3486 RepID=UPI002B41214B|nr:fasciclin-like arabinogalactan protein 12 [Humulus lupulus]
MRKQGLISISFLLFFIINHFTIALAQSPAQAPSQIQAQVPATSPTSSQPPAVESPSQVPLVQAPAHRTLANPTNVTKILEKAGGFGVFIRLLKSTSVCIQIENQLTVSNSLTILAPSNGAFAALKPGTLNSLTTEEKVQLVQYHILPSFIQIQNFQTLSNPVRTQASSTRDYPLNITVEGSWVNISTGVMNTTINGTIYEDNQLAIYKVDKVLLPLRIFAPKPRKKAVLAPAPASAPTPTLAVKPDEFPTSSLIAPALAALLKDASGALSLTGNGILTVGLAVFYVVLLSLLG